MPGYLAQHFPLRLSRYQIEVGRQVIDAMRPVTAPPGNPTESPMRPAPVWAGREEHVEIRLSELARDAGRSVAAIIYDDLVFERCGLAIRMQDEVLERI